MLFWEACARALREAEAHDLPSEEFEDLKKILAAKFLCNFSLFRSAPDSWAIRQLFPIVPLHRLAEPLDDFATFVDVTCDSDGKINHFVDLKDDKETLLNAEKVLAYDPGDLSNMVTVMQAAHKAGYYDTVMWIGRITTEANIGNPKGPDYKTFIILKNSSKTKRKDGGVFETISDNSGVIDACLLIESFGWGVFVHHHGANSIPAWYWNHRAAAVGEEAAVKEWHHPQFLCGLTFEVNPDGSVKPLR